MIHPSWASPGRQLPSCRTWVNRNGGPYPAPRRGREISAPTRPSPASGGVRFQRREGNSRRAGRDLMICTTGGKGMADTAEGFLGIGLDDALTRRQVLQAGLTGAAMLGLAACG